MPVATITSKGQVTIPREVRRALRLGAGDRLAFELHEDGTATLRPRRSSLLSLAGALKPRRRGVTLAAMEEAIRRGATAR